MLYFREKSIEWFWTLGDSYPGLQSQGESIICLLRRLRMVISDTPLVLHSHNVSTFRNKPATEHFYLLEQLGILHMTTDLLLSLHK